MAPVNSAVAKLATTDSDIVRALTASQRQAKIAEAKRKEREERGKWEDREELTEKEKKARQLKEAQEDILANSAHALDVLKRNVQREADQKTKEVTDPFERSKIRHDAAEKAKTKLARDRKNAEKKLKQTRGIVKISSFFGSGERKIVVQDPVSHVTRPLLPGETICRPTVVPPSPESSADEEQSQEEPESLPPPRDRRSFERITRLGFSPSCSCTDCQDTWVSVEEACTDPAIAAIRSTPLFRALAGEHLLELRIGCSNSPLCNATECAHLAEGGPVPPLSASEAARRSKVKPRERTNPVFMPPSPFSTTKFDDSRFLESVNRVQRNRQQRRPSEPQDNLGGRHYNLLRADLQQRMTNFDITASILSFRVFYWREMARLLARFSTNIIRLTTTRNELVAEARRRKCPLSERIAVSNFSRDSTAEESLFEQSQAGLDANLDRMVNAVVVRQVQLRNSFAMSDQTAVRSLSNIVKLADGACRGEGFYATLVSQVVVEGHTDDLLAEVERESRIFVGASKVQRASCSVRGAPPKPGQFSEKFRAQYNADRPTSVEERAKRRRTDSPERATKRAVAPRADPVATPVQLDAQTTISEDEDNMYAPVQPVPRANLSERRVDVCDAQTRFDGGEVACTPIAMVVAHRLLNAAHAAKKGGAGKVDLGTVKFADSCKMGATIWKKWRENSIAAEDERHANAEKLAEERKLTGEDREKFLVRRVIPRMMTPMDVFTSVSRIRKRMEALGHTKTEFFDESPEARSEGISDAATRFSEALAQCDKLAPDGLFTGVLTVRASSVCIARIAADQYVLFDSHGTYGRGKSTVTVFVSREELLDEISRVECCDMDRTQYALLVMHAKE